jgi:hypothetical protein
VRLHSRDDSTLYTTTLASLHRRHALALLLQYTLYMCQRPPLPTNPPGCATTTWLRFLLQVAKLELLNDVHARHLEASSTKENLDTTVGSRTSARDSLDEASPVHGTSGSHGSTTPSRAQNTPARERRSSRGAIPPPPSFHTLPLACLSTRMASVPRRQESDFAN